MKCPLNAGINNNAQRMNECSNHCEWFDSNNNGCVIRTVVNELIRLNERIEDACSRGGESKCKDMAHR